ncbi:MAG: DUF3987 domain-containing protein [Methyloglobulus sp.]|nr:DUF3987 domain-containing protein [Methyloglobulus sp.]
MYHGASNTLALDLDDYNQATAVLADVAGISLSDMLNDPGRFEIKSPKPNRGKLIFKLPVGFAGLGLRQLKLYGRVIFELRSGNCQDVVYGQHPEGGKYRLIGNPAAIPEAPAVLLDMLTHWDAWKPCFDSALGIEAESPKISPRNPQQGEHLPGRRDPIQEYNQANGIQAVLLANGYKQAGRDRFIRPGSESEAPGAVVMRNCVDGIERVYSHGGDVLNDGYGHDAFDCFCLLECGGDLNKALAWDAEITKHNQRLYIQAEQAKPNGLTFSNWPETPVEISVKLKPVLAFNFDLLPDSFKPWVRDIAHRMQCPPDYVAVSVMVELSAIVGKKGLVNPKSRDDWTVCPNLNGLNIGRPSAMKTPAANEVLKPLQRLEIKAKEAYTQALADNETQEFINKEGRVLAEKQAKALIKDKKFAAAKQVLLENPEQPDKPTRTRYLVNDATVEKLGELLNENPNGLMLYRDEISGFLKTIDREDRSNDRAFYLECFNGLGRYTYDRIGRGTIDIESLCLAILGNIQPGVLRPYLNQAAKGATGDDGMIQRFQLMVWPDLTDWQHVDQWPDKEAKNKAVAVFERLAAWQGFSEPARFDEAAQKLFDAWLCELHQELRADDIPPAIESHFGKYKSLIPSLAVLVHLADDESHRLIVGVDAIKKAIAWGDYLKSHALRVYGAALDPVNANAKTILDKIESGKLSDGFGTRDILRGGWTGLDTLDNVNAALSRLVEYGWLKQLTLPGSAKGGRPSIRYQIHPKILLNIPR